MSADEKRAVKTSTGTAHGPGYGDDESLNAIRHADDVLLAKLGYKSEFRREFSVRPYSLIGSNTSGY